MIDGMLQNLQSLTAIVVELSARLWGAPVAIMNAESFALKV